MYLAIDYGKKRIGLAAGVEYPRGLGVLENDDSALQKIAEICQEEDVDKIVIGIPKKDNGEPGGMALEIEEFATKIQESTGLPIVFEEESFTSSEAEMQLMDHGVDVRKEKGKIDELAAILILEQYINSINK